MSAFPFKFLSFSLFSFHVLDEEQNLEIHRTGRKTAVHCRILHFPINVQLDNDYLNIIDVEHRFRIQQTRRKTTVLNKIYLSTNIHLNKEIYWELPFGNIDTWMTSVSKTGMFTEIRKGEDSGTSFW